MNFRIQIHKRKIYLKPTPKKDIKDGLVVVLNKPRGEKLEPFIVADILAGEKEYPLPDLPPSIFVIRVFIKDDAQKNNN